MFRGISFWGSPPFWVCTAYPAGRRARSSNHHARRLTCKLSPTVREPLGFNPRRVETRKENSGKPSQFSIFWSSFFHMVKAPGKKCPVVMNSFQNHQGKIQTILKQMEAFQGSQHPTTLKIRPPAGLPSHVERLSRVAAFDPSFQ